MTAFWPGLLEAWLVLTSVKYHGNLYTLIPLNQRLALTRLRATGPWSFTKRSVGGKFFQPNYCHSCHTRFAVFFPPPSFCVSSLLILYFSFILLSQDKNQPFPRLWVAPRPSNSQLPSVAGKETLLGNTRSCFVSPLIARVNTHLTLRSFFESLIVTLIFSLRDTQRIY